MIIEALSVSLKIILLALPISFFVSMVLAYIITEKNICGKKIIETLLILPMFLSPATLGYIILITFGNRGAIGQAIKYITNKSLIFTWGAGVVVAVIVTLPIMYETIKNAFLNVDKEYKEAAMELGANEFQIFKKIILPLSKKGILSGIVLSFARAFGEFGATILVAGNIPGKTQTVPMVMYYAIENNDKVIANKILVITLAISVATILLNNYFIKKQP